MPKKTKPRSTNETFHLDQIRIVTAIMKEIERQFRAAGKPRPGILPFRVNAIIDGANGVVAAWQREEKKATPGMGLIAWTQCDDHGLSSDAMAYAIFNTPHVGSANRTCHPRDPEDFGRCYRFLRAVPTASDKLDSVAKLSPTWKNIIDNWDELARLYLEELPTGSAPKLYDRMKQLGC
jgi:hypothetical protein